MADKRILFLTGTRADFGKIRTLIDKVKEEAGFEYSIFVTGMHTLSRYGYTVDEVMKHFGSSRLDRGFRNVHVFMNQVHGESMDIVLGNTIFGLSRYVSEYQPDMIVVHGDRVEALAGAIVGSLRNILVAHIEGGERSGTIDELIRHAISKMAHLHFVAGEEQRDRLIQMGERENSVFVIGSPDMDLMLASNLPTIEVVRTYYEIPFESYAIALLHPVTTRPEGTKGMARAMVDAMLSAEDNFVVIYPNNDQGSDAILEEYERLKVQERFVIYPSLRVTYFLTLLRNSKYLLGNSSAGIRETPAYGVPSVNIGDRQNGRFQCSSIINTRIDAHAILESIGEAKRMNKCEPNFAFGTGDSAEKFIKEIKNLNILAISRQKQFVDISHLP
ncbi:MAG: UDP-N-acetylglucosamine 2-epimerase (hydrolyzing) [Proteobacteria bacterium]|nr:UDP-N-acetylglucosamine 2-epimerase (hydrolyzing) [Pseudomonadota bacterium]